MKKARRLFAFTLLEVLVASAILAILLVLIAQILGATTNTSAEGRERLAADREARMALDRLAIDVSRSILRPDLGFSFRQEAGNDTLAFYSEVPGRGNGSSLSAVGYRVVDGKGLERASVTIPWEDITFDPAQIPAFANSDYRLLAPGVIRMETGYLLAGDYTNPIAPNREARAVTHAHLLPAGADREWVGDLRALVVTIAVVDEENRKRFPGEWVSIADALSDGTNSSLYGLASTAPGGTINPVLSEWTGRVEDGVTGVNPAAGAAIRLYSRVIPLP
jgi:prepilin-type N-terminal cleavage/methylation domain-containing protein